MLNLVFVRVQSQLHVHKVHTNSTAYYNITLCSSQTKGLKFQTFCETFFFVHKV